MTTQIVHNKIVFMLIFEWTNPMKYFLSYIKKCQTGTYFIGWVYNIQQRNCTNEAGGLAGQCPRSMHGLGSNLVAENNFMH